MNQSINQSVDFLSCMATEKDVTIVHLSFAVVAVVVVVSLEWANSFEPMVAQNQRDWMPRSNY